MTQPKGGGSTGPASFSLDTPLIPPSPAQVHAARLALANAAISVGGADDLGDVLEALGVGQ